MSLSIPFQTEEEAAELRQQAEQNLGAQINAAKAKADEQRFWQRLKLDPLTEEVLLGLIRTHEEAADKALDTCAPEALVEHRAERKCLRVLESLLRDKCENAASELAGAEAEMQALEQTRLAMTSGA